MRVPSCVYVPVSHKPIALESIDLDTLLCSVVPVVSVQSSSFAIGWVLAGGELMGNFGPHQFASARPNETLTTRKSASFVDDFLKSGTSSQ